LIINELWNNRDLEILTGAMEVTRGINFTCKSKEFEITVKDGIMKYEPEGSQGYENRVSPITDIKHKVFPIKRFLKTKYFQSVPMSTI